jgi:hypothetical protein
VAAVARWSGFGTSTASKVLHTKRPALVPILDNQAIFGARGDRLSLEAGFEYLAVYGEAGNPAAQVRQ